MSSRRSRVCRSEEDCLESFACGGTGTGNQEPGTERKTGLTGPGSLACRCTRTGTRNTSAPQTACARIAHVIHWEWLEQPIWSRSSRCIRKNDYPLENHCWNNLYRSLYPKNVVPTFDRTFVKRIQYNSYFYAIIGHWKKREIDSTNSYLSWGKKWDELTFLVNSLMQRDRYRFGTPRYTSRVRGILRYLPIYHNTISFSCVSSLSLALSFYLTFYFRFTSWLCISFD